MFRHCVIRVSARESVPLIHICKDQLFLQVRSTLADPAIYHKVQNGSYLYLFFKHIRQRPPRNCRLLRPTAPARKMSAGKSVRNAGPIFRREFHTGLMRVRRHEPSSPGGTPAGEKRSFRRATKAVAQPITDRSQVQPRPLTLFG